jgi:hypothetical protein
LIRADLGARPRREKTDIALVASTTNAIPKKLRVRVRVRVRAAGCGRRDRYQA